MLEFAKTPAGKKYLSSIQSIARSLERIADCMEAPTQEATTDKPVVNLMESQKEKS